MSHYVDIRPSGHRIENHPGESLLESALNAGLPVNYGCSNGNCGKCRARLTRGDLERLRYSDFVFAPAERGDGWFLMCCHGAASDATIDTGVAAGSADIEFQKIDVKVRKVAPLDARYSLLHLQTPRTSRLRFLAGQSARLTGDGESCELPIASCPCDDRNIHFHIPNDTAACAGTSWLKSLRLGATLRLEGPTGNFVLDAESTRVRLMIGAGSGMAPLKSIIEHSLALTPDIPVALLLFENTDEPHHLRQLLKSWCDALENFAFDTATPGSIARSVNEFTAAATPDVAAADIYVSGPKAIVDDVLSVLDDLPGTTDRVHSFVA